MVTKTLTAFYPTGVIFYTVGVDSVQSIQVRSSVAYTCLCVIYYTDGSKVTLYNVPLTYSEIIF